MTNRFVRASKFRHVFGTATKKENSYSLNITTSPHEGNMSAVNNKFIAVVTEVQGGGAFLVAPLSKVGRFDREYPRVEGHTSKVLDIQWNPFNDNQIASGSEDCTIKIWEIPDEGLKEKLETPKSNLTGHSSKVTYVIWHPCAANVLASVAGASAGGSTFGIKLWNTESGTVLRSFDLHKELIQSFSWNYNGSFFATTCKDKKIRVIDARTGEVVSEGTGHEGTKPSRVVFCGTTNKLFSTGKTRMSDRQYALWDAADLSKPLVKENIDTGSGVLFPFWDEGTKMIYIAGKGDAAVKYFEVSDVAPYVHFLSLYQDKLPQRGVCCMPKKDLKYMKCEVMRFYILRKEYVEPLPMIVPRKSEMFQDDIFPPCPSGKPALTAEEWIGGTNKDPLLARFSDDGLTDLSEADSQVYKPFKIASRPSEDKKEPSVLKRFNSPQPDDARSTPVTLDEYRTAYKEILAENEQLKKKVAELEGK